MKTRLALAVLLCVLAASVFAVAYVELYAVQSTPSTTFTLTATGGAYDSVQRKNVVVTLFLTGKVNGNLSRLINLHVKSGSFTVEGYGAFPYSNGGTGIVIRRYNYVQLSFKIGGTYGGQTSWVRLDGGTSWKIGNSIGVWLWENRVILPLSNHPILFGLWLKGKLMPVPV